VRGPGRILAAATLVNTLGHGLFMAIATIYYTRVVGLSPAQVGAGLTTAAVFGFAVTVPLGQLTDRVGARQMTAGANLAGAGLSASLVAVTGFPTLVAVLCGQAIAAAGGTVGRSAVVASVFPAEERVRGRAYLRSLTNLGLSAGAALAVPAIAVGTPSAYRTLILCDAATFAATGLLALALPRSARLPKPEKGSRTALRDRPFLVLAVINGVLSMHARLYTVGVPLWVVTRTAAPLWTPAALLILNTVLVVSLQVLTSRGTEEPAGAATAQRRAGLLLALACLVYALSDGLPAYAALAVLAAAAIVHVFGEMLQAAGAWGLSYGLARDGRHGDYQGVYGLGGQLATMLAPLLVTVCAVELGTIGWLLLAAPFAAAGLLVLPAARWAVRDRPAAERPAPPAYAVRRHRLGTPVDAWGQPTI
jgi:MFS family permease